MFSLVQEHLPLRYLPEVPYLRAVLAVPNILRIYYKVVRRTLMLSFLHLIFIPLGCRTLTY